MSSSGEQGRVDRAGRAARAALARLRSSLGEAGGATAVEFGILLPVLMLFVLGTFEFGRALEARNKMSHALSKAVRVINLDSAQTADAITAFITADLTRYGSEDLAVSVSPTTVAGVDYVNISVTFPFNVIIPFSDTSVTLNVDTLAPMVSAVQ